MNVVGIRQGGETSTEGFKAKENAFLRRVRLHPNSLRIGRTPAGIPTVADDNCMLASSHNSAQTQLLLAQSNASRVRYIFSEAKSRVLYFPNKATKSVEPKPPLTINGSKMSYSDSETHLGLVRTTDGKADSTTSKSVQSGRRAAYKLMGAGFSGVNGISPFYTRCMVTTYVMPCLTYGLEAMVMEDKNYEVLDKYHRGLLRQLQGLPDSTATPAIYLLLGSLPCQAIIHQKILTLFISILHRDGTPEYAIMHRQLAMKTTSSSSWTAKLRLILHQYNLPLALELAGNPPSKEQWKGTVKEAIKDYWDYTLKEEARAKKTLRFLNIDICSTRYCHPVWETGTDPLQSYMATVKAMLLVDRYPLTGLKCAGKKQLELCPHCKREPENLQHFLLYCPLYNNQRTKYLSTLQEQLPHINLNNMCDDDKVKVILDPSHFALTDEDLESAERTTRRMCFSLHNTRANEDGTGPRYGWVSQRVRGMGVQSKHVKQVKASIQLQSHSKAPASADEVLLLDRRNLPQQ